jgi:hypothetical protein
MLRFRSAKVEKPYLTSFFSIAYLFLPCLYLSAVIQCILMLSSYHFQLADPRGQHEAVAVEHWPSINIELNLDTPLPSGTTWSWESSCAFCRHVAFICMCAPPAMAPLHSEHCLSDHNCNLHATVPSPRLSREKSDAHEYLYGLARLPMVPLVICLA